MTSVLRELVSVPMPSAASSTMTSRPARARARATARPTTPAPITTASAFSTEVVAFDQPCADAAQRGDARHGPRRAVEEHAEQRADRGADRKLRCADQGGGYACRAR